MTKKHNSILSDLEDRLDEQDEHLLKEVLEARKEYQLGNVKKLKDKDRPPKKHLPIT